MAFQLGQALTFPLPMHLHRNQNTENHFPIPTAKSRFHNQQCGRRQRSDKQDKSKSTSIEPHFFKCGKIHLSLPLQKLDRCFNGAALFQVRKDGVAVQGDLPGVASMGPHFFKCGKSPRQANQCLKRHCFNGAALFQVRKAPNTFPQDD